MKKSILNLGKALNKTEQKLVNGGGPSWECYGKNGGESCGSGHICCHPSEGRAPYLYCGAVGDSWCTVNHIPYNG